MNHAAFSKPNPPWIAQEALFPDDRWCATQHFAGETELAWLDTGRPDASETKAVAMIAREPIAVLEQLFGSEARLINVRGEVVQAAPNGWDLWASAHRGWQKRPLSPGPMPLGWLGYLGFESADQLEQLPPAPADDWGAPLMRIALFDRAVVLDLAAQRAWLVADPTLSDELGLEPLALDATLERWNAATRQTPRASLPAQPCVGRESSAAQHTTRVKRVLEYIAAGDIYQVNICQRLRLKEMPTPLEGFRALQSRNPAPYGALLRWGEQAVLSASPELLLSFDGQQLLTQPIKGTRPRTHDSALDAQATHELLMSDKERAELTMIVDLHRNDLGRVARHGSVRVLNPRRLEAHPAVFHTVADVVAELAEGRDSLDALRAMFPAGSIVGVPKIRALEIIRELEPVPRGVATGAVGVLGLDGRLNFNVAIRTLMQHGDEAILSVGGGIVADSQPPAEDLETLDKARGLLTALRARGEALTMPNAVPNSTA